MIPNRNRLAARRHSADSCPRKTAPRRASPKSRRSSITKGREQADEILVTGGAGFIGSAVCRHSIAKTGHASSTSTSSPMPASLGSLAPIADDASATASCRGDICDRALVRDLVEQEASTSSCILPPKAMSTARSRAARLHPDQHRRHLRCFSRRRAAYWPSCRPTGARASASTTSRPTRCYGRLPLEGGLFTETTPYAPSLALFGLQGRGRPSGDGLASHLRPAGGDDQLLQQLRALSIPREAHSAHDPERAGGRGLPVYGSGENVRDWLLCRGSRARAGARRARGESGAATMSAAATSAPIWRWCRRSATRWTS